MLAHTFSPKRWPENFSCHIQPKLNGVRALYQNGTFQSRDELPWNSLVLAHLSEPLRAMFPDERTILDGELYVHGWSLQRINGAVQIARTLPREDTKEVQFWVFDTVNYQSAFIDRVRPVFNTILQLNHPSIRAVTTVQVPSDDRAWVEKFYAETVADGFEGIIYRIGTCPYTRPKQEHTINVCFPNNSRWLSDKNNRTWHLLKRKDWHDGEFECVGVEEGLGKRASMVGAFVCKIEKNQASNRNLFTVGSGLTDAEATEYFVNPPIGKLIKVKYLTLSQDGIPLNPTVMAIL
jgi:ATP-dependent DNA ligase